MRSPGIGIEFFSSANSRDTADCAFTYMQSQQCNGSVLLLPIGNKMRLTVTADYEQLENAHKRSGTRGRSREPNFAAELP